MLDNPLVIYHFPCHDGFAAAYVAWTVYRDKAEYFPTNYNKPVPDVTDRNVIIVDFSYKREDMQRIFATAKSVVWLDHHKTAFEEWLGEMPEGQEYEDIRGKGLIRLVNYKSGAMLAWEYFHPDAIIPPRLITHVADRDLWQFRYPNTRPFFHRLSIEPYDFNVWHKIANMNEREHNKFVEDGILLESYYNKQLETVIDQTKQPCALTPLHKGLAANLPPAFQSEAGNKLAEESSTFGLIWYVHRTNIVNCSLRSNGSYDVSALAKRFGGGGHRNAAGFQCSLKQLQAFLK